MLSFSITKQEIEMKNNAGIRYSGIVLAGMLLLGWMANAQTASQQETGSETPTPETSRHSTNFSPDIKASRLDVPGNYEIGTGDVIAVSVWREAELSKSMPVRPDGKISLPVIGELRAAGLTTSQLEAQITTRLSTYIRDPQVNVVVEDIRSKTFNVMGKVLKGGSFELIKPTTVLEAIALAGGFQDYARTTRIYVLRPSSSTQTMFPFNYKAVIKGKNASENILLQPGDTVVVP